jgi:hypothetical protein
MFAFSFNSSSYSSAPPPTEEKKLLSVKGNEGQLSGRMARDLPSFFLR